MGKQQKEIVKDGEKQSVSKQERNWESNQILRIKIGPGVKTWSNFLNCSKIAQVPLLEEIKAVT